MAGLRLELLVTELKVGVPEVSLRLVLTSSRTYNVMDRTTPYYAENSTAKYEKYQTYYGRRAPLSVRGEKKGTPLSAIPRGLSA